jgi:hypothetical protein
VITHPEKVLFPDDGITKGELASYYDEVAPVMLPHIRARPVTMEPARRSSSSPIHHPIAHEPQLPERRVLVERERARG